MVVWATGVVEGASDEAGGDARLLPLEHAAMSIAAAALRARSLCLMVSRELSHINGGVRNGGCHKLSGVYVKFLGDEDQ
jgi:hypothetical protein